MASQDNSQSSKPSKPSKVSKIESKNQWNALVYQAKQQKFLIVAQFGTSWCVTSKLMKPYYEDFSLTFSDVKFVDVDMDDVREVSSKMGVKAMPTYFLMKNGIAVDEMMGVNPDELKRRISIFVRSSTATRMPY